MSNKAKEVFVLMRRGSTTAITGARPHGREVPKWERIMRSPRCLRLLNRLSQQEPDVEDSMMLELVRRLITIRAGTEFSCDMFNRLFPGEWFNAWLLLAGMKMADKPSFVRYGYSIPLGNVKSSRSKSKKKRVPTSLSGWRKKIESKPESGFLWPQA